MTIIPASQRVTTITVLVVAIVAAALGVLYGVWVIDDVFDTPFGFTAPVASPVEVVPLVQSATDRAHMLYNDVWVSSHEALPLPRALLAISHGLHFLLFVLACVVVATLCIRMLRSAPFAALARWGIATIGALAAATSIAAPWLHGLAARTAARELGLPISADEVAAPLERAEWIVPHVFSLQDTDWGLAALGTLLLLVASTYLRGERLERELRGLV